MKYTLLSCALSSLLFVQGCSIFTRPLERPVIEDSMKRSFLDPAKIGILSLTPERRIVLQNMENGRFCAENPTETGIDMASALRAAAAADLPANRKAEVSLALTSASNNYILNRRYQGVQVFQSASYNLCQFYLNAGMTNQEYLAAQKEILDAAVNLITLELNIPVAVQTMAAKERSAGAAVSSMESSVSTGAAATVKSTAKSDSEAPSNSKPTAPSAPASAASIPE